MPSITDTKYAFKYVGSPTTDAAKVKTLSGRGPLLVAQDHLLVRFMPEAFDGASHAPDYVVNIADVHHLILPAITIDDDMSDGGVHFATGSARLATLLITSR